MSQVSVHHSAAQRLVLEARDHSLDGRDELAAVALATAAIHAILDVAMAVREVEAQLRHARD